MCFVRRMSRSRCVLESTGALWRNLCNDTLLTIELPVFLSFLGTSSTCAAYCSVLYISDWNGCDQVFTDARTEYLVMFT